MWKDGKSWLGLVLLATGQALAAEPIDYDCDTPGGRFSQITFNQGQSDHRVRGTISAYELRRTSRWLPVATVSLEGEGRDAVGVQLKNNRGNSVDVSVVLVENGNRRESAVRNVSLDTPVPFEIYVPSTGQGFVVVSDVRVPLDFDLGSGAKVSISCSSGGFDFEGLDWSWQSLP